MQENFHCAIHLKHLNNVIIGSLIFTKIFAILLKIMKTVKFSPANLTIMYTYIMVGDRVESCMMFYYILLL